MAAFSDDCVFEWPRGPDPWGKRFVGKDDRPGDSVAPSEGSVSDRSAGNELITGGGASDRSPNQPAPTQCERRKHVLATVTPPIRRGSGSVVRPSFRKAPDPHRHPTSFEADPTPQVWEPMLPCPAPLGLADRAANAAPVAGRSRSPSTAPPRGPRRSSGHRGAANSWSLLEHRFSDFGRKGRVRLWLRGDRLTRCPSPHRAGEVRAEHLESLRRLPPRLLPVAPFPAAGGGSRQYG